MRINGQVTRVVAEEQLNGAAKPPRVFFRPSDPAAARKVDSRFRFASGEMALPVAEDALADFAVGDDVVADMEAKSFVRGESFETEDEETKPRRSSRSR